MKQKSTQHIDLPANFNPKFVERPKYNHDRSVKELAEILTGSTVRIHDGKNGLT